MAHSHGAIAKANAEFSFHALCGYMSIVMLKQTPHQLYEAWLSQLQLLTVKQPL